MRNFIDIVASNLVVPVISEGRNISIKVQQPFGPLKAVDIHEDPTKADMALLCQMNFAFAGESILRGFVHDGHAYVWAAGEATHTAVQKALGFEVGDTFEFYRSTLNFHVRGYGVQEGDPSKERNILITNGDAARLKGAARRWGFSVDQDGNGYY